MVGWRNEQYGIYSLGPAQRPIIAFTLERSACALFGFATYGVHLTVGPGKAADTRRIRLTIVSGSLNVRPTKPRMYIRWWLTC